MHNKYRRDVSLAFPQISIPRSYLWTYLVEWEEECPILWAEWAVVVGGAATNIMDFTFLPVHLEVLHFNSERPWSSTLIGYTASTLSAFLHCGYYIYDSVVHKALLLLSTVIFMTDVLVTTNMSALASLCLLQCITLTGSTAVYVPVHTSQMSALLSMCCSFWWILHNFRNFCD